MMSTSRVKLLEVTILVGILWLPSDVFAATQIVFDPAADVTVNTRHARSVNGIKSRVGLEQNADLEKRDCIHNSQGDEVCKYRETYDGKNVYNTIVDVENQESADRSKVVASSIYTDMEGDLASQKDCTISDDDGMQIAVSHFGVDSNEVTKEYIDNDWIFINKDDKARYAQEVALHAFINYRFIRMQVFIDMCLKTVLQAIDRSGYYTAPPTNPPTTTPAATKPPPTTNNPPPTNPPPTNEPGASCDVKDRGGNPKREIIFGPGEKEFCLHPMKRSNSGKTCHLENKYVKTVDLGGSDSDASNTVVSFTCASGYKDDRNGGYSPAMDTFFFSTQTSRMFEEWYDWKVLRDPIPYAKAALGKTYNNAYWGGNTLVLGSGDGSQTYPWCNMDTVAHELAHGVTEYASNLEYASQSGGMNEAFSDMAGEAAEAFAFGKADLLSGAEIYVAQGEVLRYFEDPTMDGSSIKHVKDFTSSTGVHSSSGVYNRVFWLMCQKLGVRNAFEIFAIANRMYWKEKTTFESGACNTLKATYDAAFDMDFVADCFKDVGIIFSGCSNFADYVSGELKAGTPQTGMKVSDLKHPLFKVNVPSGSSSMTVTASANVNVVVSTSYKRSANPLKSETKTVTLPVTGGAILYVRFAGGATPQTVSASISF